MAFFFVYKINHPFGGTKHSNYYEKIDHWTCGGRCDERISSLFLQFEGI